MQFRLSLFFAFASLASGGAGCALFFEDQLSGAGGSGGGGGASTSSTGGSSSISAGGSGTGGGGEGGSEGCVGLRTELDGGEQIQRWLRSFPGAEITALARVPGGQRLAFVGTSTGESACGVDGLEPGARLFYGELDEDTGTNPLFIDLGAAGDSEILISGGDNNDARVIWRSGSTLCAQRVADMADIQPTPADPCGANPRLRCSTTSPIAGLHAASTVPFVFGFQAASGGTMNCLTPTGLSASYSQGQVLVRTTQNASEASIFSTGEPLEQVRSSSVSGSQYEARVVGWCPANRAVAGVPCGSGGSYFQAFIGTATTDEDFTLQFPQLLEPQEATLQPRAGIHPHPRGFVFTSAEASDYVLEWGTETNASPTVPIWGGVTVPADNPGATARTEALGASAVSQNGDILVVGQLSSGIPGAATCLPEWGTCAFVMRAGLNGVITGLEAHVEAPPMSGAHAWATEGIYDGGFAGFVGGYIGGPLRHGALLGNDAGNGKAAYIARGPVL